MPSQQSNRCWDKVCDCTDKEWEHYMSQLPLPHARDSSSTIDVLTLLTGLATCCCTQLRSSSLPIYNKWKSKDSFFFLHTWRNGFLLFLSLSKDYTEMLFFHLVSSAALASIFLLPSSSQEKQLKSKRSPVLWPESFPCIAKWASSSDTGWTLQL